MPYPWVYWLPKLCFLYWLIHCVCMCVHTCMHTQACVMERTSQLESQFHPLLAVWPWRNHLIFRAFSERGHTVIKNKILTPSIVRGSRDSVTFTNRVLMKWTKSLGVHGPGMKLSCIQPPALVRAGASYAMCWHWHCLSVFLFSQLVTHFDNLLNDFRCSSPWNYTSVTLILLK